MPKVLLVEDDNNLREIFEMRLQAEGYDTVTAGNGEEGLTVAMQEKPDLIISDVMMPKLSGFEMLETLRAAPEGKDIKVIMMTALGQAEDRTRGEKLGVVKYLVKSQATLDDFARVVREVLPPTGATAAAADNTTSESSQNNQQEGKTTMPEDPSTNPAPATPPADNPMSTPSEPAAPTAPAAPSEPAPAAPASDAAGVSGDQQSTSQEQSTVTSQINDFVNNTPAADSSAPSADSMTPPASAAPSEPAPAAPASDAGMSFAPSAPAAPADNPMSTPGAPDMSAPASDATSTDAPAVPPATPPADTPPATPPQTDAPASDAATPPPADSSANAI